MGVCMMNVCAVYASLYLSLATIAYIVLLGQGSGSPPVEEQAADFAVAINGCPVEGRPARLQ